MKNKQQQGEKQSNKQKEATSREQAAKPNRRSFIKTVTFGILGTEAVLSFPLLGCSEPEEKVTDTSKPSEGIEIQKGYVVFNKETQKSMEALAETLVPGSKEIGIREIFMDRMAKNHGEAGFFDSGFWNLDSISKSTFNKPFYELQKNEDKKKVIQHVSVRNTTFFNRFRKTIIQIYYSTPSVWKRLSYGGPPQPKGFLDYTEPPKVK